MKNADTPPGDLREQPPKDILVRTFDFAVAIIRLCVELNPLIRAADEIKRVIGAIIVSTKRGGAT